MRDDGTSRIAILSRAPGKVTLDARQIAVSGQLTGMALSHDGRILAAANGTGAVLLNTARLEAGNDNPVLGYLNDGPGAGSIYVAFSPDDHYLIVSNERSLSLSVYELTQKDSGWIVRGAGQIRTGIAPVGLAFSRDGTTLFSTSEVMPGTGQTCPGESGGPGHAEGALVAIDMKAARNNPAATVVGQVAAGCNPVRVVLSPNGDRAYVTARGSDGLEVFDTAKLISDAQHARVAEVKVGKSPVGIAVTPDRIFVTNSDRFGGGVAQFVSVITANNLGAPQSQIPAGGFPRELNLTADRQTLIITNFATNSVELVDLNQARK